MVLFSLGFVGASYGANEDGGLFNHPLFRRKAVQHQGETAPKAQKSPPKKALSASPSAENAASAAAEPADCYWDGTKVVHNKSQNVDQVDDQAADQAPTAEQDSGFKDTEKLDCYWDGKKVVYNTASGDVPSDKVFEIYTTLREAQEHGSLLDGDSIMMRTAEFSKKLHEVFKMPLDEGAVVGSNIFSLVDAMIPESMLRRKDFVAAIADEETLGETYLGLVEETYRLGLIEDSQFLSYVPEGYDGFEVLERTVLAGTEWQGDGLYLAMMNAYQAHVENNQTLVERYQNSIERSLLMVQIQIEALVKEELSFPRSGFASHIRFEEYDLFGGANEQGGFLYPHFAPENSVYVLIRFFNLIKEEYPEIHEVFTEYKYGKESCTPYDRLLGVWGVNRGIDLRFALYDTAFRNQFGQEAYEVSRQTWLWNLNAYEGGTVKDYILTKLLVPIVERVSSFKQQVNQLKIGGEHQDDTYDALQNVVGNYLSGKIGQNWQQENPQNAILLDKNFIRHLFVRDGMVVGS